MSSFKMEILSIYHRYCSDKAKKKTKQRLLSVLFLVNFIKNNNSHGKNFTEKSYAVLYTKYIDIKMFYPFYNEAFNILIHFDWIVEIFLSPWVYIGNYPNKRIKLRILHISRIWIIHKSKIKSIKNLQLMGCG